jgi:hypothetical protein
MFDITCAISRVFIQIRRLFKTRPYHLNPGTWICVIRNGNLIVVRRSSIKTEDYEVMKCFLNPRQIPSLLKISVAIGKHWSALKPIALERIRSEESECQSQSSLKAPFRP